MLDVIPFPGFDLASTLLQTLFQNRAPRKRRSVHRSVYICEEKWTII